MLRYINTYCKMSIIYFFLKNKCLFHLKCLFMKCLWKWNAYFIHCKKKLIFNLFTHKWIIILCVKIFKYHRNIKKYSFSLLINPLYYTWNYASFKIHLLWIGIFFLLLFHYFFSILNNFKEKVFFTNPEISRITLNALEDYCSLKKNCHSMSLFMTYSLKYSPLLFIYHLQALLS